MMMKMPTAGDEEEHWTLRGVCLLCSLS
jgi:hypothetical protein